VNDQELLKSLSQYEDVFGDSFPTIPLMRSRTEEEIIEIIEKCISEKKDVHEMGYLPPLDDDIQY